jgi:MATE family multidrug resistance protein
MRRSSSTIAAEIRPTLALAAPIALSQLGLMLMGIVDTAMVGPLGPRAVGAVGIGTSLFAATFVTGLGLTLGIDRIAAVAFGAGRLADCRRTLVQGAYLALLGGIPLTIILQVIAGHLARLGIAPDLVPDASAYLHVLAWSLLPTLLFTVLRQTLQAMGDARAPTMVLIAANGVNLAGNQLFIHGLGSFHGIGMVGSAWATLGSRLFALFVLGLYAWRRGVIGRVPGESAGWHGATIMELLRLGIPASGQMLLEVGFFSTATLLIGGMGDVPAAAHQTVLVIASFTFMVPLGTGSAGAVRVAQALGRNDLQGAVHAGWSAVILGVGFMTCSAIMLLLAPGPILSIFGHDAATLELARKLMVCAGLFQIFDGAQVTLGGVLRGLGDTLYPMLSNLAGHWIVGLPVGLWFGFHESMGAVGIWIGLSSGLASVACVLLMLWRRRIARLLPEGSAAPSVA